MFISQPRAVLFDVDGTLLDTTEFIYGGFDHALATHDYLVPARAEYARWMGKTLASTYEGIAPGCDPDLMCETHRSWQDGNLHLAVPYPDTAPVLQALKAAGVRLAAITTRSRRTSVATIEGAGLADYFDVILSYEDVTNIKPHPEPLLIALDRLNVSPAAAVMVGDTDADILAGKAAGTRTVGVTYGFHAGTIAAHTPDALIPRLADLLPLCGIPGER